VQLTPEQVDRAVGAVLASAAGDALGVPYEFGSAPYPGWPAMVGGGLGGFAPGEWSDDTAQAFSILEVAATGADLRSTEALDAIAQNFADWHAGGPADVGIQTSAVLRRAGARPTAAELTAAATAVHEQTGKSAGNGSLMRTVPVALTHLDDPSALVEAAMKVSALTHHDPMAGEACAVWCLLLRHAILHGAWARPRSWDGFETLAELAPQPSVEWQEILLDAEERDPSAFSDNGWVVGAMQAAWSAITHTEVPEADPQRHLVLALARAIEIGHDTDTVGAIAGGMLGARWGATAVPEGWVAQLHGWRDQTGAGLRSSVNRLLDVRST
jgi:ADP-ribosyl-[dinitrogen reductase] hydrolase